MNKKRKKDDLVRFEWCKRNVWLKSVPFKRYSGSRGGGGGGRGGGGGGGGACGSIIDGGVK